MKICVGSVEGEALPPHGQQFLPFAPAVAAKIADDLAPDPAADVEGGLSSAEHLGRQYARESSPQRHLVLFAVVQVALFKLIAEAANRPIEERADRLDAVVHGTRVESPQAGEAENTRP